MEEMIKEMVHTYYWDMDINCARTMLNSLASLFNIKLQPQTLSAAVGLHGAGGYRAQCGLVEGSLMFIGIYCSERGYSAEEAVQMSYEFADKFTDYFSSLRCYDLRPNGFTENDPPHACERLTVEAISFTYDFINSKLGHLEKTKSIKF